MTIEQMITDIQANTEWLETSEGDLVECIGIENLEKILGDFLKVKVEISQE